MLDKRTSCKIKKLSILCSFLVVVIHCRARYAEGTCAWWVNQLLEGGVTHIAVPFFFAISGYMLCRHLIARDPLQVQVVSDSLSARYANEVGKRVRSLVVPFLLWNLVFFSVGIFPVLGLFYFTFGMYMWTLKCRNARFGRKISPAIAALIGLSMLVARTTVELTHPTHGFYFGFLAIPFLLYAAVRRVVHRGIWNKCTPCQCNASFYSQRCCGVIWRKMTMLKMKWRR